ncbi:MAG TPA: S1 RNA-binding domain-containing protein [Spirochaetia bacterium]|nr:S1 RNA-binding domain-containing protein [Spirochaetia bacterium]
MIREVPPPEGTAVSPAWQGDADWVFFYRAWQGRGVFKACCAGLEEEGAGRRLVFRLGRIKGCLPEVEAAVGRHILSLPGRFLYCLITDIRRGTGEVVLSRRLALEQVRALTWPSLAPGLTLPAVVEAVYPGRGALVDVGGVRAILPPAEMAWGWVADPRRVVQPRQVITVRVRSVDRAAGKVLVSLKDLQEDPWLTLADRYRENARYMATVTGTAGDAVFVSFEPGVTGCCRGVRDSPPPGAGVLVQVTEIDRTRRRMAGWLVKRLTAV